MICPAVFRKSNWCGLSALSLVLTLGTGLGSPQVALAQSPADTPAICGSNAKFPGDFDLVEGRNGLFFRAGTDLHEFFRISDDTQATLARFSRLLAAHGSTLVVVPLPTRGIMQSQYLQVAEQKQGDFDVDFAKTEFHAYVAQLRAAGIAAVDLVDALPAAEQENGFFYLRDHHWTTQGAHETAQVVADLIKTLPVYQDMTQATFETKVIGPVEHKTSMALEIDRACATQVPPEADLDYSTSQVVQSSDDLFGDSAESSTIALVGSSFSATKEFHFDDFLSQETGMTVANYAANGAEFIGSLATLLFSNDFQAAPAKIIVWEAPSYYPIDQDVFSAFRQITASIYGRCTDDNLIKSSNTINLAGEQNVLSLDADQKISGNKYYAVVESSQPGLTGINLSFNYADGNRETVTLGGFERFTDDGTFFTELNDEIVGSLTSVAVSGDSGTATVKVDLCRVPERFQEVMP